MLDQELLRILVCPVCKGELQLKDDYLICSKDRLKYPIREDIPIMLAEEAIPLTEEESAGDPLDR